MEFGLAGPWCPRVHGTAPTDPCEQPTIAQARRLWLGAASVWVAMQVVFNLVAAVHDQTGALVQARGRAGAGAAAGTFLAPLTWTALPAAHLLVANLTCLPLLSLPQVLSHTSGLWDSSACTTPLDWQAEHCQAARTIAAAGPGAHGAGMLLGVPGCAVVAGSCRFGCYFGVTCSAVASAAMLLQRLAAVRRPCAAGCAHAHHAQTQQERRYNGLHSRRHR